MVFKKKKDRQMKAWKGRRLPIIIVTFEDDLEGWIYVQRCCFGQEVDVRVEQVRNGFRRSVKGRDGGRS